MEYYRQWHLHGSYLRFLGLFDKLWKEIISYVMSVCSYVRPSVGMGQLCPHWKDFRGIGYLNTFGKYVEKIQV
jgi:hypothetical protein